MGRKKILKIPNSAKLKCPHCGKISRIKMEKECIYSFKCKKCKKELEVPESRCCILCAYSDTQCYPNLLREAQRKNLEVRNFIDIN